MDDKALTIKTVNPAYEEAVRTFALASLTPSTFLPVGGRTLARMSEDKEEGDDYSEEPDELTVDALDEAEIITSMTENGKHMPVLDIDVPCEYIPSTTPGHGHLYFHKEMSWSQFEKLMKVMVECGLVEEGYASASHARGYSAVRLPWMTKDTFIFKGWVKCADSSKEEAFALPDVVKESYNPKEDLLTVAKLGSANERWAIVYQYLLNPNAEKSELTGKYIYASHYNDEGVTIEDLMGAKGGVLTAAKAHEAGKPTDKNWHIVEPAPKPKTELTKSYLHSKAATKALKAEKKKAAAEAFSKGGAIFASNLSAASITASDAFKDTALSAGTHVSGGTLDYSDIDTKMAESTLKVSYTKSPADWTNSELQTLAAMSEHPLTPVSAVDGSTPAIEVPQFIFSKPVATLLIKSAYGMTQIVVTYKHGISPLFIMSTTTKAWKVETAWTSTVSGAQTALGWKKYIKVAFDDLDVTVPEEPIPAPPEPTVHYESEDGHFAFDIPESYIKPYVKVHYFGGSYVKNLFVFNKGWDGGVKFKVSDGKPNFDNPKTISADQVDAEHGSMSFSTFWHPLKKTKVAKPEASKPEAKKYVSKADPSVTVELPEGMWSEDCNVLLYNGNQVKKLVVCDKDWSTGKYFMIKALYGTKTPEPEDLHAGDAFSYKSLLPYGMVKSGNWHAMKPATQ